MVLYGVTGALFAYCISLAMTTPLAAFAAVAGYQVVMFIVSAAMIFIANACLINDFIALSRRVSFGFNVCQIKRC